MAFPPPPPISALVEEEQRAPPRDPGGPPDAGAAHPPPSANAIAPSEPADEADARSLAILFPVRRAQRAFLSLPAVLLLFLEPREQSRRRAERPELEDDPAVLLVLRHAEDALALRNHVD